MKKTYIAIVLYVNVEFAHCYIYKVLSHDPATRILRCDNV